MIRQVGVTFINTYGGTSKQYCFKSDLDLQIGDKVVCDCSTGLSVGEVVNIHDEVTTKATRWVVQKVDLTEHKAKMERQRALANLEKEMTRRAKELTDVRRFEILAQGDPQMAMLLSRYKYLVNGGEVNV